MSADAGRVPALGLPARRGATPVVPRVPTAPLAPAGAAPVGTPPDDAPTAFTRPVGTALPVAALPVAALPVAALPVAAPRSPRRDPLRLLARIATCLLVVVGIAGLAWARTQGILDSPESLRSAVGSLGAAGPVVYVLASALAVIAFP